MTLSEGNATGDKPAVVGPAAGAVAGLLVVVVAGDLLLYGPGSPGIGLAALIGLVGLATLVLNLAPGARPWFPAAIAVFILLLPPLVEAPGLPGVLLALAGIGLLALAASGRQPASSLDLPAVALRFAGPAPFRLVVDALTAVAEGTSAALGRHFARALLMWVVPGLLALVFVGLFAAANPLIENLLLAIRPTDVLRSLDPWRVVFWGLLACTFWPFLRFRLLSSAPRAESFGPFRPRAESLLFGPGAILRALVLFNLLFLIQTGLDATYLWGGVALPDGMTYAHYAHRGAYPLVATALLAAAFVLVAMRPGGAAEGRHLIRRLVYLFIAQNVVLVISSMLRLVLYVETYLLTGLRVAAGIWMGLVAVGLLLILLRIALGKSNKWLISMNLLSLGLTLHVTSYLDFSAMIARYNVEHSREMGGSGVPLDLAYLRRLGPTIIPALDLYLDGADGRAGAMTAVAATMRVDLARRVTEDGADWRGWTWRGQRLRDYLDTHPGPVTVPGPSLDPTVSMP